MNKTYLKMVVVLAMLFVVSACGGKAAKKEKAPTGPVTDITRPPQVVKKPSASQETNPEETVSFDEWRKEKQAESE